MPLFGKRKTTGDMSGTHRYENRFVGLRRRTGFFCALLSLLAGGVMPDGFARESDEEEAMLSPVVVTASRGERLEENAIASTTVVTSQAIRNRRLADLPSILRSEAGIEFDRMGGPGMVTSVYMRGSNANRVLVQIDGVPVNDGSVMGSAALLSHLQPDQIERIEVVRGDVTAIYGGGASGGVIRIFTKQGEGKPSVRLFGEYGSRDTSRMGAGVSGRVNDTRFSLSAVHSETDGFSTMSSSKNPLVNDDRDGDRLDTISGSLSHRFGTDGEIGARWYFSDARYDYDVGSGPDEINTGENRQWVGALYGKKRMTADWLSSVTLSRMEIDRHYETKNGLVRPPVQWGGTMLPAYDPNGTSDSRTEHTLLQWQNDVALSGDWSATAGADVAHERSESGKNGMDSVSSRNRYSLYGGVSGKTGMHDWQANVRYDQVDDAGSEWAGYLGYAWRLAQDWKLTTSVSSSFLAPSLYQLYNPMYGNTQLKAETSRAGDVGIEYAAGVTRVRLTAFAWYTRDLIDFDSDLRYMNIGKARNRGLELTGRTVLAGLDVDGAVTLQDLEDCSTGETLLRRARRLASVNVSRTSGRWYAGGSVQYTGERTDSGHDLPSYWLASLDVRYRISQEVSLYGRIENLFDRDYETVYGYNQPGRGVYVGVSLKM